MIFCLVDCLNDICSSNICNNSISSLIIDVIERAKQYVEEDMNTFLFTQIFGRFPKLKYFNYCPSWFGFPQLCLDISPPAVSSSTRLELHVIVERFFRGNWNLRYLSLYCDTG